MTWFLVASAAASTSTAVAAVYLAVQARRTRARVEELAESARGLHTATPLLPVVPEQRTGEGTHR